MKAAAYCVLLMMATGLLSCNEEPSGIGSDFFQSGSLSLVTVDTLTVQTATVMFDSLVTSDATRLLVGYHEDNDLGIVSSSTFFQVAPQSSLILDGDLTTYSRIELRLTYDGYSYYDTTSIVTLNIHRLTEDLEIDDAYLYNTSSFQYDTRSLGTISLIPRPNASDTLVIRLADGFGRDIVQLAQNSASEVSTIADFLHYFKGIAITPANTSGPILGFSTAAEIRVYYIDKSQTPGVEKYLSIPAGETLHFNQVRCDRSSTALRGLRSQEEHYSSSQTGDKGYIQSGAGLGLRIEIPYLRDMVRENGDLTVVDAVLEIAPAREASDQNKNAGLPRWLVMSAVNYKNEIYGNYEEQPLLIEDVYLGRDTHYEVNIRDFVTQQLVIAEINKNALLFTFADSTFRSSVTRLYAGDQHNAREMKLKIYCVKFSK